MGKSQRRIGHFKKGLNRPTNVRQKRITNLHSQQRQLDHSDQVQVSLVFPASPSVGAPAIPYRQYITVYRRILSFLQPNNKNTKIKHRDQERQNLIDFIKQSFNVTGQPVNIKSHPSVMIAFGQAGLGKTLLFHDILKDLHEKPLCDFLKPNVSKHSKKRISIYYFNSMSFDHPRELLMNILQEVFKREITIKDNEDPYYYIQILRKRLKGILRRRFIIVMIDELDHLYYKCPASFYSMIEFFNISYRGFVKIGISNTLNFVSHVTGNFSLLNIKFLIFKPYTVAQLKDILLDRIIEATKDNDVTWAELIMPSAIELLTKKVISNNSSDVRFLLSCMNEVITNKIIDIRETARSQGENPEVMPITPFEVQDLVKTKLSRKYADIIETFGFPQKLILLALCKLMKEERVFINKKEVQKLYKKLLRNFDMENKVEFEVLLDNLVGYGFIKLIKDSSKVFIKSELSKGELVGYIKEVSVLKKEFEKM